MTDMFSKPESAGPYLVTAIKIWKAAPPCNRYSSATNRLSMRVRGGLRDRLRRRGPSPAQEHDAAGAPLCQGTKLAKNGIRALEAYDWRGDPDTAALPAPSGYVLSTYNHVLSTTYLAREAWASVDPAIVCPPFRSCRLWSKRNTSGWGGPGRERGRHVQGRSAAYEAAIPSATTTAHPRSSPTVMLPAPVEQPTNGAAIDAEEYLWNARFAGAAVVRLAPDGRVERIVELQVTKPTSRCLGSPT